MTLVESMNLVMDYIESRLEEDIDYKEMAAAACTSQYEMQRMFAFATGVPISEYIRRRRLTLAAEALQQSGERIVDLALRFGYQSPDAFSRAFQALHGLPPSKCREKGVTLKYYPRLTFTLTLKGVVALEYKIVEKPAFRVIGIKKFMTAGGQQLKDIPKMWDGFSQEGLGKLAALREEGGAFLGLCADMYNNGFDYWIGVPSVMECPPGYEEYRVPACTWAVFDAYGKLPHSLQKVVGRAYQEWLPNSSYRHADAPEVEWYDPAGDVDADGYHSQYWIPVVNK